MTTLPAVVTIVDLPTGTTMSGVELFECVQTSNGVALSVQKPLTEMLATSFGALPSGGTVGQFLQKSSSTNYASAWGAVNLASSASVTGVLGVVNGGLGTAALATFGVLFGNGTAAAGVTALGTTGWPLVAAGSAVAPSFAVLEVPGGGSGTTTLTANSVLLGAGTSTFGQVAAATAGWLLAAQGTGSAPAYQQVNLGSSASMTGVLTVSRGGQGTSTLTAFGALYGNGTSAVGITATAATGTVLTSNGTGAAPSFQQPAMTWIETLTASSSTTLTSSTFSSSYNDYMVVVDNLVPSTSGTIRMLVESAATFQLTSYINSSSTATTYVSLSDTFSVGSTAGAGASLVFWLKNVNSTTNYKILMGYGGAVGASAVVAITFGAYWAGGQTSVTRVQFLLGTGVFTTGTIAFYGLRGS